jgi:hypothetical protein
VNTYQKALCQGISYPGQGKIDFADPAVRATFDAEINYEDFDGRQMWPFTTNNNDYRFS